ncbi:cytochrome c oxidase assembly protein [Paracoccus sp. 1_MG-2023]|uniref:cytochrome c oxidase assembly protein n=1 Tax=unclassified Paracoccus (in: a-proteobacteria) TaxID=2688777 RepID=UPI001C091351|nr:MULTISPECIES: cytochrome c oxidase assembly protein [unclassified Paracoccus (in: a-proteobacteria)]MBU2957542.1 cytochrome c oxidase assembly protein [Paracoccus sp. C2R09]MDO6669798.1 cytochrome c oxidase assembly protein [Paracoccus sp. 1_MG-2023]
MKRPGREARTALGLVGVVLTMGALAWAAVPFYNWFCSVTGFGGTTQVAETASDEILDEIVRVRFDANVDDNLGWTFRPMQNRMDLRIGENGLAFYEAVNNTDQPLTGTASYNVAPDVSGYYFIKIECFCFTEQTLQPGERIEMPVNFYVDPEIVQDRDASWVRDITLSYTFHRTEPQSAALDTGTSGTIN